MKIQFTQKVGLRYGPQYNPGEVIDLPQPEADDLVGLGLALRVPPTEPPHPPRVIESATDRMVRRQDGQRKHREG